MRELVYLSESKMEQFIPDLSSLWPKPRITIKTPFAGLDLDMSATRKKSQLKHLKLIVKQIERSARWFGDQYLCPGEWAAFEAPLNYLTMKCGESVQVLFSSTLRSPSTIMHPAGPGSCSMDLQGT